MLPDNLVKQIVDNKALVVHLIPIIHQIRQANSALTKNELLESDGAIEKAIDALEGVTVEVKESMKSFPLLTILLDVYDFIEKGEITIDKVMLLASPTEEIVDQTIDVIIPDSIEKHIPVEMRKSLIKAIVASIARAIKSCTGKNAVNVAETSA